MFLSSQCSCFCECCLWVPFNNSKVLQFYQEYHMKITWNLCWKLFTKFFPKVFPNSGYKIHQKHVILHGSWRVFTGKKLTSKLRVDHTIKIVFEQQIDEKCAWRTAFGFPLRHDYYLAACSRWNCPHDSFSFLLSQLNIATCRIIQIDRSFVCFWGLLGPLTSFLRRFSRAQHYRHPLFPLQEATKLIFSACKVIYAYIPGILLKKVKILSLRAESDEQFLRVLMVN